ncbi:GntR family transcriptional regulator [Sedimentitalea todarodis]|uniref:GntR family transcriptional regulator n=1 Tax=Sedimentitalea todarodis TaxID=1631240 RepID=A0ABU3VKW5_9RHOB|nr:GntR family transcriptional regulator [Sedimentitalea todarodis]MDU9006795.1 GntR family transcriptional regulator [Sedimentitalea todarodis]
MQLISELPKRRTTTDLVFDRLYKDILSLTLLPGTKLSEAEIARRFGVSRQPVRDAFNKLKSQDLLLIRPQKATEVRGFSMERIAHVRFVRLAVEMEVVRCACANWQPDHSEILAENLADQKKASELAQPDIFHRLDYDFHKRICELGGHRMAFETIQDCKQKTDRLCVLSLGRQSEIATLYQDHRDLAQALDARDADKAADVVRRHLGRLDDTITEIHLKHSEYFE